MTFPSLRSPTLNHALVVVLFLVGSSQLTVGFLLYQRLESQLEADLARRLVHVAMLLTLSVDAPLAAQFRAGDEDLPAYALVRERLRRQAEAAGVSRAYVFDATLRTLVDTEEGRPGSVRHRLSSHPTEIQRALSGTPAATRLYADEGDRLRLTALAPVHDRRGRVTMLVGVDAPPAFFAPLAVLRREMLLLGFAGILLAGLGGALVLRQVSARLRKLRDSITGAMEGTMAKRGSVDPIGALGEDLDELLSALLASREYQEAVLGSVDVGLVTCDRTERITLANPRSRALLGRDDAPLVGRHLSELVAHEEALASFIRWAQASPVPVSSEIPWSGGPAVGGKILAASASRLVLEGRPSGLVLSLQDVTDLRGAERRARENERLAALGGMAGGLLHELGNPLAGLTIYLDLLRAETLGGEARDLLERSIRESARLQEFLEDFRAFAGLSPLRLETIRLADLARQAMMSLGSRPDIEQRVEAEGEVRGDGRLLAHAIRNLLRNAIEALPEGGLVQLAIGCDDGETVATVTDDGDGLSAAEIDRILEPFHTTKPHGSGLGLMIARRVAELHGGSLEVRSRPGEGSAFTLRWPIR